MANPIVVGVISLVIAVIMVVNVLVPIVKDGNTDGFTSSELAIYSLITLASFIGLMYSSFAVWGLA
jgi:hypothetical protein